jgi:hypothetical protein
MRSLARPVWLAVSLRRNDDLVIGLAGRMTASLCSWPPKGANKKIRPHFLLCQIDGDFNILPGALHRINNTVATGEYRARGRKGATGRRLSPHPPPDQESVQCGSPARTSPLRAPINRLIDAPGEPIHAATAITVLRVTMYHNCTANSDTIGGCGWRDSRTSVRIRGMTGREERDDPLAGATVGAVT